MLSRNMFRGDLWRESRDLFERSSPEFADRLQIPVTKDFGALPFKMLRIFLTISINEIKRFTNGKK